VHWRAALRDIGLATVDYGDDAFLFAARSLECCARAISSRGGEVSSSEWGALASRIGFASDDLRALKDPLAKARHAVAQRELLGLLVQITDQTQDMMLMRVEDSDRDDVQTTARELRAATARLCSIVYAVTAVHSLGSAES
jgi:hypothetical protein